MKGIGWDEGRLTIHVEERLQVPGEEQADRPVGFVDRVQVLGELRRAQQRVRATALPVAHSVYGECNSEKRNVRVMQGSLDLLKLLPVH